MQPSLDDLVVLLVRGAAEPRFAGIHESRRPDRRPRVWRVWRRGRLARIEDPPGTMSLIAGERTYWRKWSIDPQVVAIPRSPDHDEFELSALTLREPERYWRGWLGRDPALVARTLQAVTYEGRDAWRFTAPESKGGRPVLTVDAELGLVVRVERNDLDVLDRWSRLSTDTELDDALFRYDGPWQRDPHSRYPEGWLPE